MDSKTCLLQALQSYISGTTVPWTEELPREDWVALFTLASMQHVLPMVYEAVYSCAAFQSIDNDLVQSLKAQVKQEIVLQTMKTADFLDLYSKLRERGVKALVVKGIVCRSLYPEPDERASNDEDVWIRREDFETCDALFREQNLMYAFPEQDPYEEGEVSYRAANGPLYIELHKELFPGDSEAYGNMNTFFEGAFDRAIEVEIEGMKVYTMAPTDHLLYLICHAFKHFLHSGFGIRQVCDITLFADHYGAEIDWGYVLKCCREMRADFFAAALFKIGEKYLVFDPDTARYPEEWRSIEVEEEELLEDLLQAGVYGQSDMSRKHSSNITLEAVIADKRGAKASGSVWKSVFRPAKSLEGRYPYLKKCRLLLPIAWMQRVLQYLKETKGRGQENSAAESIRIGEQRIELLRKYGIIK